MRDVCKTELNKLMQPTLAPAGRFRACGWVRAQSTCFEAEEEGFGFGLRFGRMLVESRWEGSEAMVSEKGKLWKFRCGRSLVQVWVCSIHREKGKKFWLPAWFCWGLLARVSWMTQWLEASKDAAPQAANAAVPAPSYLTEKRDIINQWIEKPQSDRTALYSITWLRTGTPILSCQEQKCLSQKLCSCTKSRQLSSQALPSVGQF